VPRPTFERSTFLLQAKNVKFVFLYFGLLNDTFSTAALASYGRTMKGDELERICKEAAVA
jgi:hypothetical protein